LVFLGVFMSFYLFLRLLNRKLDITAAVIMALIGIACSITCRYYKPELFSALLFSWLVLIYFYAKVTHKKNCFYFFPLLFLFWVNFHGAFVVGLVFLAVVLVGEIFNRVFFPQESFSFTELVHFGIACVLSLAALLVNPYGMDYLISTYQGITSQHYAGLQNKYIMAWVSLWPALRDTSDNFYVNGYTAWIMTVMVLLVLLLSIYSMIKKKSFDFALILVSMALYWKGMETVRASYFFPVTFFFVFYWLIFRLNLQAVVQKATLFSLLLFFLLFENVFYFNLRLNSENRWLGAGLEDFVPAREVEFLKNANCRDGCLMTMSSAVI